jgi:RNA polymerase sigma factor (sigma-70 family)
MAIETLGAALRHIKRLFDEGVVSGRSDGQLLDLFIEEHDEAAFEALLVRHGPMVLSVCRGILRDPYDAEDAFQATFLVMVKKAVTIRGRHVLGGWLYQVAHRVAIQANKAAARRRACEREAGQMASKTTPSGPASAEQLLPALHEEIALLPEKHRLAVVLCELEGMTQPQAAVALEWSERTLRRRLVEARARLKRRLARRGLAPDGAMLGAAFLREARSALPAAWRQTTVRAALDLVKPSLTAGAVSAAAGSLTREVLNIMLVQKMKLATAALLGAGLMAWGTSAALISRGDEPPKAAPAAVAPRAVQAPAAQPEPDPVDAVGVLPVHGHVLDPDGKPVAGAEIYVHHYTFDVLASAGGSYPVYRSSQVAVTDGDDRFHFDLDKSASDFPYRDYPVWHDATIAAVAPGYGPAWVTAGSLLKGGEATLQLVRDDVPIRGRVLDSQGRPVAGVTIRARALYELDKGADKDAILASGEGDLWRKASYYNGPTWLGNQGTWTTDRDGRFEVRGVGRDRIIGLEFRNPALADSFLYVMTRTSQAPARPRSWPRQPARNSMTGPPNPLLVPATFEHIVVPCKPITGVIRSKGTGQPLAGVHVIGAVSGTWDEVSALSDSQGRFRLVGIPKAKSYTVRAAPRSGIDPFLGARITVTDTEGLKPIETALELPKGVIVTGRLIDIATGRLARAKHVIHRKVPANHNEGSATLGYSGLGDPIFRITVPPGEGMIFANVRGTDLPYSRARLRPADQGKGIGDTGDVESSALGAYHAYRMIDVPADAKSIAIDLELTRGETRKGRLAGPDGKPVIGAKYCGHSDAWAETKTLTDDTFEVFALNAGHPRLVIFGHKDRRLVGWAVITDEELKSDATMVVHLQRAGSIKGRLVDEDGLPMAGATLYVQPQYPDNQYPGTARQEVWPDGVDLTSRADGQFLIDGLKPGLKSSIYVYSKDRPGYSLDTGDIFRNVTIQAGEMRDVGDVKVKPRPE